ncbi:MAG TPA: ABC transporter permease, partial [Thermoanaerobaculia bacterium]|nr:ABC transporter permease [Thermoanaerobaculia bacterium]
MLLQIARFEFRYLLRNPLLWATAFFGFAMFFFSISTGNFELGSEGGLLENAACALLRDYTTISVFFMFVTTSFVANAVIRDDETGYGPIIRSTPLTKAEYLFGRFLGAFAIAAVCMLVVPLAVVLGSVMPWANVADLGPNRLIDHLYGYFLIALPNIFIHAAVFFALATITRSMMATYLGVIGFVFGFFYLEGAYRDRPDLQSIFGIAEPFGARAINNAIRYWTVAERNVRLPEFSGTLLYNRLLWIGIAALVLALAYALFRFADQGMTKRERKKMAASQAEVPEVYPTTTRVQLPSPTHGNAAMRALVWMRTKFEVKQVVLSAAFPVLMAWGLYITFFVLITQRDPDGKPTYPTTLSLIPEIEDAFQVVPLIIAIYYAGELVWRERDRRTHELIDASPMPNWGYVLPKTLAMAVVLMSALLTTVIASVIIQLSLGFTHLELGKYVLWYLLPRTWDMLLLAAVAVFVQALVPHKTIGWGIMVLFLVWQHVNTFVDHNLLNYGETPGIPLSDLNGAGSFWKGAWTFRFYWGAFAVLLLVAAHLLWRRGTELRLRRRLARARRSLYGASRWVAIAALFAFAATGAYAYYNTNVLNHYETPKTREADLVEYERLYGKYQGIPQPMVRDMVLNVALYPKERRAVTKGRYRLRNETSKPIGEVHVRLFDQDLEIVSATIEGGRLIHNDAKHDYRI